MASCFSKIVAAGKNNRMSAVFLKLSGWLCLPFCCVGYVCLAPGYICDTLSDNCKKLIELYGGSARLQILAQKIAKELEIFRDAVTLANTVVQPSVIRPDITIIDVIADMNPRIGPIIRNDISLILFPNNNNSYSTEIWKNYQNDGGNYHVIVYGLIEYLFTVYPPDSIFVDSYINKALKDSSLRTEMLSHKTMALM